MTIAAPRPLDLNMIAQLRASVHNVTAWFESHATEIVSALIAGAIVYLALRFVRRTIRRAAHRHEDATGFTATLLRTLARTGHFFLIMAATRLVIGFANPPELLASTVRLLFIVAFTLQVAIWARELVMAIVRYRAQAAPGETLGNALTLINILVSVALFSIAGIVILDNLNVNVTGLVAGLGIGGIAIGLAAQGIFADLFAALSIIFDRPFRIGDAIAYDATTATVERIGLKSTRLRSVNGQQLIISNTNLLGKEIANFARLDRRRISMPIGIIYQTDVDAMRAIPALIEQIITDAGHHFIRAGFIAFNASSLDFEILFDVASDDYDVVQRARHAVGLDIFTALKARDIAFAYPTQTSFTAAPDGTMVLPYAAPADSPPASAKTTPARQR